MSNDILHLKLQNALNFQIEYRCDEIARIIEEFGSKELQNAYPFIIESLFGISNQIGWGLRCTYRKNHSREFDILFRFLHPQGPLMKLAYKLLSDPYVKFEFPLEYLPHNIKQSIEEGISPPFYLDKIQFDQQNKVPRHLLLNSFEYFIFHYAYHLVNPNIRIQPNVWNHWETVYLHIIEEYLVYFLPCDGSPVVPEVTNYNLQQRYDGPIRGTFPQIHEQLKFSNAFHFTQTHRNPFMEIWRSELIARVFIDFWFSIKEINMHETNSLHSPYFVAPSYENRQPQLDSSFSYSDKLPNLEHVRAVRNLIKYLHYFTNSGVKDLTAMDDLKRIVISSNQSQIYRFLKTTITRWPLDSSFRLILEAWLSYIQPWRYINYEKKGRNNYRENDERPERFIDRKWLPFIANNLLTYTVIFHQVIDRFSNLDLVAPKNSMMLFRLTKVFAQENLNQMIAELEGCLDSSIKINRVGSFYQNYTNENSYRISNISNEFDKYIPSIQQQIEELEGTKFIYKPLFNEAYKQKIQRFLFIVFKADINAKSIIHQLEKSRMNRSTSFFNKIKNFLMLNDGNEYSFEDRSKVAAYLETAIEQLISIFNVPEPSESDLNILESSVNTQGIDSSFIQSHFDSPLGIKPKFKCQGDFSRLSWRDGKNDLEGDPELWPIMTHENTLLVRLFFNVTSTLNERFSSEMSYYFHRQDFIGRITRLVLNPPRLIRSYDKSIPGHSRRVETLLPPRLSLRRLASHRLICYFFAGMAMMYFLRGWGPIQYFLMLFLIWIAHLFVRALLEPWIFGNSSINSGFSRIIRTPSSPSYEFDISN